MDLLLEQMEIDIENGDYEHVSTYDAVIDGLMKIFSEKILEDIIEVFNELKENAEDWRNFEAIRKETLVNTGDEILSEDIAWELVYN